jgi:hypothetical protein
LIGGVVARLRRIERDDLFGRFGGALSVKWVHIGGFLCRRADPFADELTVLRPRGFAFVHGNAFQPHTAHAAEAVIVGIVVTTVAAKHDVYPLQKSDVEEAELL